MTRIAIMIPARLNSQRVPRKNIRLINGIPLVGYSILAAREAVNKYGVHADIIVNSESDLLADIATQYSVGFYKRDDRLSTNQIQNDDFVQDFFMNSEYDKIIQLLPTSPFITGLDIYNFYTVFTKGHCDTLVSVKEVRIECMYENSALNFMKSSPLKASQDLEPVRAYACGLMAWERKTYLHNMHIGGAYHGFTGVTAYYPLSGVATLDIDTEADFFIAEQVAKALVLPRNAPQYYGFKDQTNVEVNVPEILKNDGIEKRVFDFENITITELEQVIAAMGVGNWAFRIINSPSNSATLISQLPGQGNRRHYHPDWDEWWYIVRGKYEFFIYDKTMEISEGQLVFIPRNIVHQITAIGNQPAIRLAVSRADVEHVYVGSVKK